MEPLLVLLASGGVVVVATRLRRRRDDRRRTAVELEAVLALVAEDVLHLGEELEQLGRSVAIDELDEESRRWHQTALDTYDDVGRSVSRIGSADEISRVVAALTTARHALACLRARTEERPAPERVTPCFFDPRHGPATGDVLWTQPGRGTRSVPACAADTARHAAGEQPEVRMVSIGARRVPYWAAGDLFRSYTNASFASSIDSNALLQARRDHKAFLAFDAWPGTRFDGDFARRDPT